jgi:hypothetical protein
VRRSHGAQDRPVTVSRTGVSGWAEPVRDSETMTGGREKEGGREGGREMDGW